MNKKHRDQEQMQLGRTSRTRKASEWSLYLTPRYIFGVILILASFTSAYWISEASDRTITVWASTVDLGPGELITDGDITPIRVRLPENAEQYLDARIEIVGTYVLRGIGASELIPSFAITSESDLTLNRVPISVAREWVPIDLGSGALVDVYGVPNQKNQMIGNTPRKSRLLLSEITIESIDESARELGGRIGMTLLVPSNSVFDFVSSVDDFEFLLVRRPTLEQ